jgi:peptidoglycan/LPS O-acetylase OafA/YrhL
MIAGAAFAQDKLAAPAAWLIGGVAAGALAIYVLRTHDVPYDLWVHPLSVGAASAAAVFGSAALEKRFGIAAPMWAVVLGDASYAIYLWHVPVLGALVRVIAPVTPPGVIPRALAIAVMFAIMIAVGIAVYKYVERPLTRTLNNSIKTEWKA